MPAANELLAPDRIVAAVGALGGLGYLLHRVLRYEREFVDDQGNYIVQQSEELGTLRRLPARVATLEADVITARAETAACHRDRDEDRARMARLEARLAELEG